MCYSISITFNTVQCTVKVLKGTIDFVEQTIDSERGCTSKFILSSSAFQKPF